MCADVAPFTVRRFADIDSTQRYVLEQARQGALEGLVAVADHQSAGRGRLGRRWQAPPGANLLMSVLLRPRMPVDELHLCTVAVALAAQDACAASAGLAADLKWPNDLMVGDRKLAGVLAEAVAGSPPGPEVAAVVVGLGLNVRWPPPEVPPPEVPPSDPDESRRTGVPGGPDELARADDADPDTDDPAEIAHSATSLWRETGTELDPAILLNSLLTELASRLEALGDDRGRRRLSEDYRRRCVTLGRRVRVSTPTGAFVGVATDLTREGHLVVDVDGEATTIAAGDVVHLRDAG